MTSPHLAPRTIRGDSWAVGINTHNDTGEYLPARYMARCVGGFVRETIDLPSKPSQEARRYTENIPIDDRTDAYRGDTRGGKGVISVIISVDADSEKMEPRCQQLEDTTSALLADSLQLVPRGQYRSWEVAFVALWSSGQFFSRRSIRTTNLFVNWMRRFLKQLNQIRIKYIINIIIIAISSTSYC